MNVICYVDGFNLYHGLRSKGWKKFYWLDLWKLTERFLLPQQELRELVYCTARVKKNPPARRNQRAYIDAISSFRPGIKVLYGHYIAKEVRCRRCGHAYLHHEEKMTDVNIACQLLVDAIAVKFDSAILISGDSDLVPPIQIIRKQFPQKRIISLFPPDRTSEFVKKATHGFRNINETDVRHSLLPEIIESSIGKQIVRPKAWS